MPDKADKWVAWHAPYSDPHSPLSRRLRIIQTQIRSRLLFQPSVPTQIISLCAGQGHDLLEVLERLPEQRDINALLIESDPKNASVALGRVRELGLPNVDIRFADAGNSNSYVGATPADLVLLCGIFGNISDHDIYRTIEFLPQLCSTGATVIWTRSRRDPDITPAIRLSFAARGFREQAFIAPPGEMFSVGVNTFQGEPVPLTLGEQLFTFL